LTFPEHADAEFRRLIKITFIVEMAA